MWDSEVVPLLEEQPGLQTLSLLEWLQERYPGQYSDKLLPNLAASGKGLACAIRAFEAVMFRQLHELGWQDLSDFTELKGVSITIAGVPLPHLLYHFRLAYSGWCDVKVVLGGGEFTALAEGLSAASASTFPPYRQRLFQVG